MRYEEALGYLKNAEKFGIVPGLDVIRQLLDRLDHPEKSLKVIHVAGTNGKGSVLAYLASIFRESGYRAGRYVSPALRFYEERFLINEEPISRDQVCAYVSRVREAALALERETGKQPTVFELETAMAFCYFKDQHVDAVLLETGMGGRLDATNVIEHPICCGIASISTDHTKYLGNSLEEIAGEKAGIIKEGVTVVSYDQEVCVNEVISQQAKEMHAPVRMVQSNRIRILQEGPEGSAFSYTNSDGKHYEKIEIPLAGRHQIFNAAMALEILDSIRNYYCINGFQMEEGMRKTIWQGRIQRLSKQPDVIYDGAHNPDGMKQLAFFLKQNYVNSYIRCIIGVFADKDYPEMIKIISGVADKIVAVKPPTDRALPAHELFLEASEKAVCAREAFDITQCVREQIKESAPEDVVVICGSLSLLKELPWNDLKKS